MSYSFDIISKQALRAAKQACARIREIYSEGFESWTKDDGSFLTEADQASSKIIVDELKILGIPIICEEESIPSYDERSQWEYFWSVDPLDGTKEFVNRTGEFSVNIALIKGQDPIFGLIASPMTEEVLFGGMDSGVFFGTWSKMDDFQKIESPVTMESLVVIGSKDYALKKMNDIFPEGWPKGTKFIQKGSALKFFGQSTFLS
jgi:3'(2'), 5'-bisphosphate nucleotidase